MENKEYIDFIDEFIKSEEFIIFKKEIEKELCIISLEYKISIEDMARSCDGYVEMGKKLVLYLVRNIRMLKRLSFMIKL